MEYFADALADEKSLLKLYREKFLEEGMSNPDRCDFEAFCSIILPPQFCLLKTDDYNDPMFQQNLSAAQSVVETQ